MRMCDVLAAVCVLLLMRQHVCMYILNDRARFLAAAAAHPKGDSNTATSSCFLLAQIFYAAGAPPCSDAPEVRPLLHASAGTEVSHVPGSAAATPMAGGGGGGVLVAEGYWQECCRLVAAYQAWLDSGADSREQAREQVPTERVVR